MPANDATIIMCPTCGKGMRLDSQAGDMVGCPDCGTLVATSAQPPQVVPRPTVTPIERLARVTQNYAPQAYAPEPYEPRASNSTALTSLIFGILALIVCWIPMVGALALPVGAIGCVLSLIGIIVACARRGHGLGYAMGGGLLCLLAFWIGWMNIAAVQSTLEAMTAGFAGTESDIASDDSTSQQDGSATAAEKQEYISKIALYEFQAKYYESYSGETPGVEFKLKNNGDKTLARVEVTVYFTDSRGIIIHEEEYYPVTRYSFSSDNKPLRPGYIWQLERGKFYGAPSVPSEWKVGWAKAVITDIEFSE